MNKDTLQSKLAEAFESHGVPGTAVATTSEGTVDFFSAGVGDRVSGEAVTPDTLFQIGSISKTFTATACMLAIRDGYLELDTRVREVLPRFSVADSEVSSTVTLRHLLSHQCGWQGDVFYRFDGSDRAVEQYVAGMSSFSQIHQLGQAINYCNSGYVVAGRMLESVFKSSYEQIIKELIFQPLGMRASGFCEEQGMQQRASKGHLGGAPVALWPIQRCMSPSGGIVSSTRDMIAYIDYHLKEGRNPESCLSEMYRAQQEFLGEVTGCGWFLSKLAGKKVLAHGGLTLGYAALLVLVPHLDSGIIVLTNDFTGGVLTGKVVDRFMEYHQLSEADKVTPKKVTNESSLPGKYDSDFQTVTISKNDEGATIEIVPKLGFPWEGCEPLPSSGALRFGQLSGREGVVLEGRLSGQRGTIVELDGIEFLAMGTRLHRRVES